jgi:hypothetical protein
MLKKTVKFEDFDGNEMVRDFYFNLSKPEMIKLQASVPGGLDKYLQKIGNTGDIQGIADFIRKIIVEAYGEKGEDGISFIKVKNGVKLGEQFEQTLAYEALFMELISGDNNAQAFTDFLTGVIPHDLLKQAQEQQFLAQKNS